MSGTLDCTLHIGVEQFKCIYYQQNASDDVHGRASNSIQVVDDGEKVLSLHTQVEEHVGRDGGELSTRVQAGLL